MHTCTLILFFLPGFYGKKFLCIFIFTTINRNWKAKVEKYFFSGWMKFNFIFSILNLRNIWNIKHYEVHSFIHLSRINTLRGKFLKQKNRENFFPCFWKMYEDWIIYGSASKFKKSIAWKFRIVELMHLSKVYNLCIRVFLN